MPVTVKTFANFGEAASALSSDRSARYLGGGTLVMRALNEGDVSISTVVRATDQALSRIDVASSRITLGAGVSTMVSTSSVLSAALITVLAAAGSVCRI